MPIGGDSKKDSALRGPGWNQKWDEDETEECRRICVYEVHSGGREPQLKAPET